jgi:hypothetical protein
VAIFLERVSDSLRSSAFLPRQGREVINPDLAIMNILLRCDALTTPNAAGRLTHDILINIVSLFGVIVGALALRVHGGEVVSADDSRRGAISVEIAFCLVVIAERLHIADPFVA